MGGRIGAGRTRPEHREWSDQLYATYARGREARTMAAIVSESGLPPADRRAMAFAEAFEREFIAQPGGRRTLDETFEVGWRLLETLPRDDLFRIGDATWDVRRGRGAP
jgi:V/A-type H+-transporting ATPase subunit B